MSTRDVVKVCGLLTLFAWAPAARADVLYLRPGSVAAIRDMLPKDAAGTSPAKILEVTLKGEVLLRGRIVGWFPGDPKLPYSEIPKDRRAMPPTGWGAPVLRFAVGLTKAARPIPTSGPTSAAASANPAILTISLAEVGHIKHECDHFQDLRWMLSNRDEILAARLGLQPAQATWGQPAIDAYLRVELGLDDAAKLPWGPLAKLKSPTPDAEDSVTLREGWLLYWLKHGPQQSAAAREEMRKRMERREAFLPMLMYNTAGSGHDLLRAAAVDYRYGGIFHGGQPEQPYFYVACVAVLSHLCDLAATQPTDARHKRMREVGLNTRRAVIEALEQAQVGRLDPMDLDNKAVMAGALPENSAQRERMLAHLKNARTAEIKSLLDLLPDPVQPTTVALVGLKVIASAPSWKTCLTDPTGKRPEDAERLVAAVVGLFHEGEKPEPRTTDWGRTRPDKTPWDEEFGPVTVIRRQVLTALGIGTDTTGLLNGPDKAHFAPHFIRFLIDGDRQQRLLATRAMIMTGPGDAKTVESVLSRLFAAAITNIDEGEPIPDGTDAKERAARERRNQRRRHATRLRDDAIVALARLATAFASDAAGGYRDSVFGRLDNLYQADAEGWGGRGGRQFVKRVQTLHGSAAAGAGLDRFAAQYQRNTQRYVTKMVSLHRQHAARALEALTGKDKVKEDRARTILNVIARIQKGAD